MSQIAPFNPWLHEYYSRYTAPRQNPAGMSVAILIGSADISGGTYVIFEHALWLQRHGARVTIITLFPLSAAARWHPALDELRFATMDEVAGHESFDVAVATWWRTIFELPRLRFRHAVYFVQSAEPRFYADNHERPAAGIAELTYTFGLPVITIATWLQMYLAFEHAAPSFLCRNGIDKSRYSPVGPALSPRIPGQLRVLVEGAIDVPMKGVMQAIQLARESGADEVWLLTPSQVTEVDGCDRVISRVPADQTGPVYRSCDVLLKLSHVEGMFGPPLEMFHCGGTVVTYNVTGADEYVEHEVNGLVAPMGDTEGIVADLRRLRQHPELLESLRAAALETARLWPDWETSSREFGRILHAISRQRPIDNLRTMMTIAGAHQIHESVARGD